MKLSQFGYISKAIASFPLNNPSRPAMNPYLRDKPSQAPDKDDNLNPIAQELYQSLTGTLLYLAIGTRPDILCSVHDRARKTQQATNRDLYAAQRILRYIMHTYDRCITFDGQQPLEVFGYADSTFNTDADRKSKFGYCFNLGRFSGMFLSVVKKSTLVALSSSEAEYYAMCEACRELLWIRTFLMELGFEKIPCKIIYQDNQQTIDWANVEAISDRTKHIDIKYHFVKSLVAAGKVEPRYLDTRSMPPDLFTKEVTDESFNVLSPQLLGDKWSGLSSTRVPQFMVDDPSSNVFEKA